MTTRTAELNGNCCPHCRGQAKRDLKRRGYLPISTVPELNWPAVTAFAHSSEGVKGSDGGYGVEGFLVIVSCGDQKIWKRQPHAGPRQSIARMSGFS